MKWVLIPVLSALIGWLTNFIAVMMIFRPFKPVTVFGITFWGLVPRRQVAIAERVGDMIQKDLISFPEILGKVSEMDHSETIGEFLHEVIEPYLLMMVLPDWVPHKIRDPFEKKKDQLTVKIQQKTTVYVQNKLPHVLEKAGPSLEKQVNIKELVVEKISNFDPEKLEGIILNVAKKELKSIEFFGGLLGFVIGLMQLLLITFLENGF